MSLRCRKRIKEVFGWVKTTAGLAQLKLRRLVKAAFTFALVAQNIIRLPKTGIGNADGWSIIAPGLNCPAAC
ncbi:hypothetical protein ACVMIX_005062 [Rhizobium leguminosarum]|uniref:Transposase DDE domain-containing protein n=1 Tax=Rhizobium leguminosarum TaxID=384 RepID=A0A2Z4YQS2_RHILE|nr:hypothetical protein DLJ82_7366 [Rhizobium leguminosarum]KZS52833.1 hypothetical protein AS890_15300 [Rhizobium anhuiense bv. trifolii]MBA9036828.1 hypothetical protein [Rhizobium leguminosarum]